jgi:hypothetical protein
LAVRAYWSGINVTSKDVEETMAHIENKPKPPDQREHKKSVRTIIGIAIVLALGVVLYEIRGTSPDTQASSAAPTISRDVANNTHVPKDL